MNVDTKTPESISNYVSVLMPDYTLKQVPLPKEMTIKKFLRSNFSDDYPELSLYNDGKLIRFDRYVNPLYRYVLSSKDTRKENRKISIQIKGSTNIVDINIGGLSKISKVKEVFSHQILLHMKYIKSIKFNDQIIKEDQTVFQLAIAKNECLLFEVQEVKFILPNGEIFSSYYDPLLRKRVLNETCSRFNCKEDEIIILSHRKEKISDDHKFGMELDQNFIISGANSGIKYQFQYEKTGDVQELSIEQNNKFDSIKNKISDLFYLNGAPFDLYFEGKEIDNTQDLFSIGQDNKITIKMHEKPDEYVYHFVSTNYSDLAISFRCSPTCINAKYELIKYDMAFAIEDISLKYEDNLIDSNTFYLPYSCPNYSQIYIVFSGEEYDFEFPDKSIVKYTFPYGSNGQDAIDYLSEKFDTNAVITIGCFELNSNKNRNIKLKALLHNSTDKVFHFNYGFTFIMPNKKEKTYPNDSIFNVIKKIEKEIKYQSICFIHNETMYTSDIEKQMSDLDIHGQEKLPINLMIKFSIMISNSVIIDFKFANMNATFQEIMSSLQEKCQATNFTLEYNGKEIELDSPIISFHNKVLKLVEL